MNVSKAIVSVLAAASAMFALVRRAWSLRERQVGAVVDAALEEVRT